MNDDFAKSIRGLEACERHVQAGAPSVFFSADDCLRRLLAHCGEFGKNVAQSVPAPSTEALSYGCKIAAAIRREFGVVADR